MMNEDAEKLGCTGTHYANPHGLHNENHYTTAHDQYLVALEAVKSPEFTKICNTESKKIAPTNLTKEERYFYTTNYLISKLKQPGYIYYPAKGIKTGHTTPAGHCLVSNGGKGQYDLNQRRYGRGCSRRRDHPTALPKPPGCLIGDLITLQRRRLSGAARAWPKTR